MNLKNIPKPYTFKRSKERNIIDIIFDDTVILRVPKMCNDCYSLHTSVVAALNGAFFEGYVQKEREIKMEKTKDTT